jgi:hypothetical protein
MGAYPASQATRTVARRLPGVGRGMRLRMAAVTINGTSRSSSRSSRKPFPPRCRALSHHDPVGLERPDLRRQPWIWSKPTMTADARHGLGLDPASWRAAHAATRSSAPSPICGAARTGRVATVLPSARCGCGPAMRGASTIRRSDRPPACAKHRPAR